MFKRVRSDVNDGQGRDYSASKLVDASSHQLAEGVYNELQEFRANFTALNSQFFSWVSRANVSSPELPWTEAAREYVKYADALTERNRHLLKFNADHVAQYLSKQSPNGGAASPSASTPPNPSSAPCPSLPPFSVTQSNDAHQHPAKFAFGGSLGAQPAPNGLPAASTSTFTFGASPAAPATSKPAVDASLAAKGFGSGTQPGSVVGAGAGGFSFGKASAAPAASSAAPLFGVLAPAATSAPAFMFGGSSGAAASAGGATWGALAASAAASAPAASAQAGSSSSFLFGSTSTAPAASTSTAPAASTSAFSFGQAAASCAAAAEPFGVGAGAAAPAAATGGLFSFGAAGGAPPSTSIFGSSASTFGAAAAPSVPSFGFGAASTTGGFSFGAPPSAGQPGDAAADNDADDGADAQAPADEFAANPTAVQADASLEVLAKVKALLRPMLRKGDGSGAAEPQTKTVGFLTLRRFIDKPKEPMLCFGLENGKVIMTAAVRKATKYTPNLTAGNLGLTASYKDGDKFVACGCIVRAKPDLMADFHKTLTATQAEL